MGERLKGKVAVVTGVGGPSIGQGCALAFAREGASVVGCDNNAGAAEETEALCRAEGLSYASFVADLTDPAANEALMAFAVERFGGLDILMNCAAFGEFAPFAGMDYEKHWRRTVVGELDLVFLACKAAWPHLVARGGGSIINMASANAYVSNPAPGATAHCATKGGVLAMTRELAVIHARENIRVNALCPGPLRTELLMKFLDTDEKKQRRLVHVPMGRFGEAKEMAEAALWLASDESSYTTGTEFVVDGGLTAAYVTPE